MFNQSKYTNTYNQIITRAKSRLLDSYTEKHHIIPHSMGGSNDMQNLVNLTAREHFICHWLLIKMVTGANRAKMLFAFNMMRMNSTNHNNESRYISPIMARIYEKYRIEHAKNISEMNTGRISHRKGLKLEGIELEKQRERTKNRRQLTPLEVASRSAKNSIAHTGRKNSDATKLKMSLAQKGKLKGPMSEENKASISATLKGRAKSIESVKKRSATLNQLASEGKHHTQIMLTCPYCSITVKKLNYARWHGDNCKLNN